MAPSLTRAISYTFWQRESRKLGIESKCLKKIVNYKRSLCCSGSWYLSPGGQSPGWVTQQVRIKQNKVPDSSMSRSVERTHQGAHSSNTQVHTKETSPAFSCFSCFYFPLSVCHTLTATHRRVRLYTHALWVTNLLWAKHVTSLLVFLHPVLWTKVKLKWFPICLT